MPPSVHVLNVELSTCSKKRRKMYTFMKKDFKVATFSAHGTSGEKMT